MISARFDLTLMRSFVFSPPGSPAPLGSLLYHDSPGVIYVFLHTFFSSSLAIPAHTLSCSFLPRSS